MDKSLDRKLARIHEDPNGRDFILADAKDADMAFGIAAPGLSPEHEDGGFRSLAEYRTAIRRNTLQGLLDIMLMSVSTNELLTIREGLFRGSRVTPAVRVNDTTDIHAARGSCYTTAPSRPFRTALLDHAQCGRAGCSESERRLGADLGLYSITFNNDPDLDIRALEAYKAFRVEAEQKGFRHFLEIFSPNAPTCPIPPERLGGYLNDLIARSLAGVASAGRPIFLKMVYRGPKWMEELVRYDPHLVPGILGGSAGTTHDAFRLLEEAQAHGARAALFGRKINQAEHQLGFIQFLRMIADGQIGAEEAVRAYHGVLQGLGVRPKRSLQDDLKLTEPALGRSAGSASISIPEASGAVSGNEAGGYPTRPDGSPDFQKMTSDQRLAFHRERLGRLG